MIRANSIVIAFDFGLRKIGIAIGQFLTCTSQPLIVLPSKNYCPDWKKIQKLLYEWQPNIIIVGLPLNMDGSEQFMTIHARIFARKLKKFYNGKIILHDERLSTVEARNQIFQNEGYRALKKKKIDAYAAVIILESWFLKIMHHTIIKN